MREVTIRKYRDIQNRFNHLYNVERKRYDDCIDQLMSEYYIISRVTISRIMTTDLPDIQSIEDPSQLKLFSE